VNPGQKSHLFIICKHSGFIVHLFRHRHNPQHAMLCQDELLHRNGSHHFAVFSPQHLSTQLASPLPVFAPCIQHPASNPGGLCFTFGFGNFGCFIFFSCALRWGFVLPFQRSLDCKFLVIDDSLTTNPSISLPILT